MVAFRVETILVGYVSNSVDFSGFVSVGIRPFDYNRGIFDVFVQNVTFFFPNCPIATFEAKTIVAKK